MKEALLCMQVSMRDTRFGERAANLADSLGGGIGLDNARLPSR